MENKGNIKLVNIIKDKAATYDLYIGRPNFHLGLPGSKWGNPFHLKREGDRASIVAQHEAYVRDTPELIAALPELKGLTLACYCCTFSNEGGFEGKMCHGMNLIKLYDEFCE